MAESDIQTFRDELPDIFQDKKPPSGWEDYHIIPADIKDEYTDRDEQNRVNPVEEALNDRVENWTPADIGTTDGMDAPPRYDPETAFTRPPNVHGLNVATRFPGGPLQHEASDYPPPDAFAFYLPFHYYHPTLWGVYLIAEGVIWLALQLRINSGWDEERGDFKLTTGKAVTAAQLFLYYHEAFHHNTESFAARLEVTHRQPLYRLGFQDLFDATFLTEDCLEEALANAYAFRKVEQALNRRGWRTSAVSKGLRAYIEGQPPGYNRGMEFVDNEVFKQGRYQFSELNHQQALPHARKDLGIWGMFGHAFTGVSRINSYTNYLIRADSPLLERSDLHGRYIGYKQLKKRLKEEVGLRLKRQGKGSHEIYETGDGKTVTLYFKNGDVPKGTLNSILKQAGVDMSIHDFLRS